MQQSRPSISGRTQIYGFFADPVEHLQAPAGLNARFERHGIDAVCVPLHVTAEHFAATVAGLRHLRNFAGYGVSIPHKVMAARLCDELAPSRPGGDEQEQEGNRDAETRHAAADLHGLSWGAPR